MRNNDCIKKASDNGNEEKNPKLLKNQKGFLTLDFLFSSLIFGIFASLFFGIAMTFSIVEVIQYMTFSSARSYSMADISETDQVDRGRQKFERLSGTPAFRPLVSNGWFELGDVQLADFNEELASDADVTDDAETFVGARVQLNAPILFKRLPALGATASDRDTFFATIQSFLGREPTQDECQLFTGQRIEPIAEIYSATDTDAYALQTDNGC